jgi:PadR family transcriptional regulator PadR
MGTAAKAWFIAEIGRPMYDSCMLDDVRMTTNVARVLRALLTEPTGEHYGYDLMRETGLKSGNLYPILARLEAARWIEGHREAIDPGNAKRPIRRYYTFTPDGTVRARQAMADLHAALGMSSPTFGRVRPAGGAA